MSGATGPGEAAAEPGLRRVLGQHHATAMVVGTIIGASIFVQPSEVTAHVPTLTATAAVWLVAGFLTLLGALATAELAARMPECGGVYAYLRECWTPLLGFLWGWAMFWTMHSAIIAIIAMVLVRYLGTFVELGDLGARAVAAAVIVGLSILNVLGVRRSGDLQALLTGAKLAAILLIVIVGLAMGPRADVPAVEVAVPAAAGLSDFLLALMAALFAFGGWHMVTYNAEETQDPRRTIPRALLVGVPLVTLSYVALNAVYFYVLPVATVIGSDRVAADAAEAVVGGGGSGFLSILVVASTFGALTGIVQTGPRVYYAMARDGLAFGWLATVHPRYGTPHRAIVMQCLWAVVLVMTGSYRTLFTRVVYTEWIFFALMVLGLFRLRRMAAASYRLPGFPWTAVVFVAASAAVVGNQLLTAPAESAVGLAFVLTGIPVYLIWNRTRPRAAGAEAP